MTDYPDQLGHFVVLAGPLALHPISQAIAGTSARARRLPSACSCGRENLGRIGPGRRPEHFARKAGPEMIDARAGRQQVTSERRLIVLKSAPNKNVVRLIISPPTT